jgi:ParB/RepB/Spo0J family partition protein
MKVISFDIFRKFLYNKCMEQKPKGVNMTEPRFERIPLSDIIPDPMQPRNIPTLDDLIEKTKAGDVHSSEILDKLYDLANSIMNSGLEQPISVYPDKENGKYVIYDGNRRWLALNILSRQGNYNDNVLCQIRDIPKSGTDLLLGQLTVNLQREDLNVFELARSLSQIFDEIKEQGGEIRVLEKDERVNTIVLTPGAPDEIIWEAIEKRMGISRSRRYQIQAVLKLPVQIQKIAESANLPESRLRYLLKIKDEELLGTLVQQMVQEKLSNAEIRKLIDKYQNEHENDSFPKPIQIKSTLQPIMALAKLVAETDNAAYLISKKDPRTVENYRQLIPDLREAISNMQKMLDRLDYLQEE